MAQLTATQMIALEWSFIAITFVLVALRLYLRLYLRQRRGLKMISDVFVVVGWGFFLLQASMDTKLLKLGLFYGRIDPTQEMDAFGKNGLGSHDDHVLALKLLFVESVLYYGAMYCVKFAMLAFYFELIPRVLKTLRKALYIVTVVTGATWVTIICMKIFICKPVKGNWSTGKEYCPSMFSIVSNGIEWGLHVFTDCLIYALPLFLLPHLKLPLSQKVGVGITFALGFVCIAFANIVQVALMDPDPTPMTWLYSALEQTWALIVVCCPAFKFFLTRDVRRWTDRVRSSNSGSRSFKKNRIVNGAVVSDVIEIIGGLDRKGSEARIVGSEEEMGERSREPSPPRSRELTTIQEKDDPQSPRLPARGI